jgi:hypothetical protein
MELRKDDFRQISKETMRTYDWTYSRQLWMKRSQDTLPKSYKFLHFPKSKTPYLTIWSHDDKFLGWLYINMKEYDKSQQFLFKTKNEKEYFVEMYEKK